MFEVQNKASFFPENHEVADLISLRMNLHYRRPKLANCIKQFRHRRQV